AAAACTARVLVFSVITVLLFAPPVELTARLADVWDVRSDLPRLLGYVPLENMVYAFFNFFLGDNHDRTVAVA
ncbi:MAG: hypothetical protein TR69_WS6001001127, partial [candidate division WS6 bacterium OLB20]